MNQIQDFKLIEQDIVPVYETDKGMKIVFARELHESLCVATRFNDWINRNLLNVGFIEDEDFHSFLSKTNGRPAQDYILTLDTAKHVSMIQRTEIGMKIRQRFIDLEKEHQHKPQTIEDLIILQANSMKELKKEVASTKQELTTVKHRIDNWDKVDPNGDAQQRLNTMIRKYAAQNGIAFSEAWKHFRRSFNNAYRTNIKTLMKNFKSKHGLKSITAPQYLSMSDRLDDAIRVADKMLNSQTFLANR